MPFPEDPPFGLLPVFGTNVIQADWDEPVERILYFGDPISRMPVYVRLHPLMILSLKIRNPYERLEAGSQMILKHFFPELR